ncbi:MAG TPA: transposase [Bacteroidales bacterium]|nr:transposase [Bacteroidales bacterium]
MPCRVHFNLSDPGAEEALYDMESMGRFVGVGLGNEPVSDDTTIRKFRSFLEVYFLGERAFREINAHLESRKIRLFRGTTIDATIVKARA